jgi:hyaluronan synthase
MTVWFPACTFLLSGVYAWLWTGYEPVPPLLAHQCPPVTVIVPAYNEGQGVFDTIASILASDLPSFHLHVIMVDDGSVDDTYQWLLKANEQWPDQTTLLQHPVNRGKREALEWAFSLVKTEYAVTGIC